MSDNPQDATLRLLADRSPGNSICPSEVARAISAGGDWRSAMPSIHAAVDDLLEKRVIHISWKGRQLQRRAGPYRIIACAANGRDDAGK